MNECKKKWNNLRDAFRRAIKKTSTTSDQSAKRIKKWKHEEEMSFSRVHTRERDTVSSLNILSDGGNKTNIDESATNDVEEGDNDVDLNSSITRLKDNQNLITNTESPSITSKDKIRRQKLFSSQKQLNKTHMRKRKQATESVSPALMNYIIKTQEENNEKKIEQDDLDHFFLVIASTVRNFTPHNQNLAKAEIFSIISDLELKELNPCQKQPHLLGNTPSSAYILPQSTELLHSRTREITYPTIQNIQYNPTASSSSCGNYLQIFSPEDY